MRRPPSPDLFFNQKAGAQEMTDSIASAMAKRNAERADDLHRAALQALTACRDCWTDQPPRHPRSSDKKEVIRHIDRLGSTQGDELGFFAEVLSVLKSVSLESPPFPDVAVCACSWLECMTEGLNYTAASRARCGWGSLDRDEDKNPSLYVGALEIRARFEGIKPSRHLYAPVFWDALQILSTPAENQGAAILASTDLTERAFAVLIKSIKLVMSPASSWPIGPHRASAESAIADLTKVICLYPERFGENKELPLRLVGTLRRHHGLAPDADISVILMFSGTQIVLDGFLEFPELVAMPAVVALTQRQILTEAAAPEALPRPHRSF